MVVFRTYVSYFNNIISSSQVQNTIFLCQNTTMSNISQQKNTEKKINTFVNSTLVIVDVII